MTTTNDEPAPLRIELTNRSSITAAQIEGITNYEVAAQLAAHLAAMAELASAHAQYTRAVTYQRPDADSRMLSTHGGISMAQRVEEARLAAPAAVSVSLAVETVAARKRDVEAARAAQEESNGN